MQYNVAEMFLFPEITVLNTKACIIRKRMLLNKELVLFIPELSARLSPTSSMVNGY